MAARFRSYIHVILQIFIRDIKRLACNPIACIILIGVCVLPALYAWYTIAAMWNPYSDTSSMKVAIVNEDAGADSEYTGHIDIGSDVVAELKDNHQLDWQFVSHDEAMEGVYSSRYYGAIILPEDFSQDFVSIFTGHFTQPKIEYYANEKLSGSGTKVTDSAASELERTINDSFVSTVSKKVVDLAQKMGAQVEGGADKAQGSLADAVSKSKQAIADNRTMADSLIPTLEGAAASARDAANTARSLYDGVPALEERLVQASDTLASVRSSLNSYSAEIGKTATESALALSQAAAEANVAAGKAAGAMAKSKGSVDAAAADAQAALGDTNTLLDRLRQSPDASSAAIQNIISAIETENNTTSATISALASLSADLDANAQAIAGATDAISSAADSAQQEISDAVSTYQTTTLPQIDASLDGMADAFGTLEGALGSTKTLLAQDADLLDQLASILEESENECTTAASMLEGIETSLDDALTDLRSLQNASAFKELTTLMDANPTDVATFMSSPVELETVEIYPVSSYGSGIAPFFSNLALWVCGFILMAVVRIRVDPEGLPKFTPVQGYFGRWLFYIAVGIVQSIVICSGDIILGIQCISPAAFIGAGILAGFVYVNLMFALAVSLRHIGKALSVVLLVMQIPGSSGMFPVEMLPGFFQAINPFLPFTYSIDAMREAIGGFYGAHYTTDMLCLGLGFVPLGLLIGLAGVRYGYNLNALFDAKLGSTDLFNSEAVPKGTHWFKLRPMLKTLLGTGEYRQKIILRAKKFDERYPVLLRIGWISLVAMPLAMMAVLILAGGSTDEKLLLMSVFIACTLIVGVYIVVISYVDADIQHQLSVAHQDSGNGVSPKRKVRRVRRKASGSNSEDAALPLLADSDAIHLPYTETHDGTEDALHHTETGDGNA